MKTLARRLRTNPTEAEKILWRHLRLRQIEGHKFRRQFPLGKYVVDFLCLEVRLIVEIDGDQHAERVMQDVQCTAWLNQQGFSVLRFWNNQVTQEIEAVKAVILEALRSTPPPQPSPVKGEGDCAISAPSPVRGEGDHSVPSPLMGEG